MFYKKKKTYLYDEALDVEGFGSEFLLALGFEVEGCSFSGSDLRKSYIKSISRIFSQSYLSSGAKNIRHTTPFAICNRPAIAANMPRNLILDKLSFLQSSIPKKVNILQKVNNPTKKL